MVIANPYAESAAHSNLAINICARMEDTVSSRRRWRMRHRSRLISMFYNERTGAEMNEEIFILISCD